MEKKLSVGSGGSVFKVIRISDRKALALKRVPLQELSAEDMRQARLEVSLMTRLHHPFIVECLDSFIFDGEDLCMIMGYMSQGDLASAISTRHAAMATNSPVASSLMAPSVGGRRGADKDDSDEQTAPNSGQQQQHVVRGPGGGQRRHFAGHRNQRDETAVAFGRPSFPEQRVRDLPPNVGAPPPNSSSPRTRGDGRTQTARSTAPPPYFSEDVILRWFVQLGLAVHFLHSHGIMHRDIKPQNIFIDGTTGDCILGDLGVAQLLTTSSGTVDSSGAAGDDDNGDGAAVLPLKGTPLYMAPEVLRGQRPGLAADVWALGCVLYELAALSHPFESRDVASLIIKIARLEPPAIPRVYSPELTQLCSWLLTPDPAARPTMDAILSSPFVNAYVRNIADEKLLQRQTNEQRGGQGRDEAASGYSGASPAARWATGQVVAPTWNPSASHDNLSRQLTLFLPNFTPPRPWHQQVMHDASPSSSFPTATTTALAPAKQPRVHQAPSNNAAFPQQHQLQQPPTSWATPPPQRRQEEEPRHWHEGSPRVQQTTTTTAAFSSPSAPWHQQQAHSGQQSEGSYVVPSAHATPTRQPPHPLHAAAMPSTPARAGIAMIQQQPTRAAGRQLQPPPSPIATASVQSGATGGGWETSSTAGVSVASSGRRAHMRPQPSAGPSSSIDPNHVSPDALKQVCRERDDTYSETRHRFQEGMFGHNVRGDGVRRAVALAMSPPSGPPSHMSPAAAQQQSNILPSRRTHKIF